MLAPRLQASGLRQTTVDQQPQGTEYQSIIKALTEKPVATQFERRRVGFENMAALVNQGFAHMVAVALSGGCSACVCLCQFV